MFAFDTDLKAQQICRKSAALNGVAERVTVLGECLPSALASLLAQKPAAFLVVDCEGYEFELIVGDVLGAAQAASLLIECHDFVVAGITKTLVERLAPSHSVEIIPEGARDPTG